MDTVLKLDHHRQSFVSAYEFPYYAQSLKPLFSFSFLFSLCKQNHSDSIHFVCVVSSLGCFEMKSMHAQVNKELLMRDFEEKIIRLGTF